MPRNLPNLARWELLFRAGRFVTHCRCDGNNPVIIGKVSIIADAEDRRRGHRIRRRLSCLSCGRGVGRRAVRSVREQCESLTEYFPSVSLVEVYQSPRKGEALPDPVGLAEIDRIAPDVDELWERYRALSNREGVSDFYALEREAEMRLTPPVPTPDWAIEAVERDQAQQRKKKRLRHLLECSEAVVDGCYDSRRINPCVAPEVALADRASAAHKKRLRKLQELEDCLERKCCKAHSEAKKRYYEENQ